MSHQCNGVDTAHDWHYIIGVGKFNCGKDFDAKIMVMMMMTMAMVMIENLEGGRNVATWRVHVRPPVEHVVGAENQLGGKHSHISGADTCLRIAKITQCLRKISLTSIKCSVDRAGLERTQVGESAPSRLEGGSTSAGADKV